MTKQSRRKFIADFKSKVVLEALKERSTIEELSKKYEVYSTQINTWKREFLNKAVSVFSDKNDESKGKRRRTQKSSTPR